MSNDFNSENENLNNNTNNFNENGSSNMGNGYTNTFVYSDDFNKNVKKNRSKTLKVIGVTAGIVFVTLTGGIIGGAVTYKMMSTNKVVESTSYVAPEFTSSTDGNLTISEAFEKVKPAVVTISTKSIQSYGGMFSQEVEGLGSGFIINEDGYVLTNYHVVEGSTDVTVLLSDGNEVSAKVINYDEDQDMAMLKLADGTTIPGVAELGDSDALYPGQDVIAVGTPLSKSFAQTITKGIVSAVGREVQSESGNTIQCIQTDAAINAGNSGGPLINTKGQVIGINSMKIGSSSSSSSTSVEGMGFSIPINAAKERIESLSKPILTLGIKVIEVDEEKAKQYSLPQGLYIKEVTEFSPAEKAGLKPGDVITKFDGKEVKTLSELTEIKSKKNEGDVVKVVVERSGKEVEVDLELAAN